MRKICIYFIPFFIVLTFFFKLNVFAAETSRTIDFLKDYNKAEFTFMFKDEQSHNIEITTPSGAVVTKESDSMEVLVRVDDARKGKYVINITAENDIDVEINVECFNTTISESVDDITVTSQFSGLKIYFIDGDLCLNWDDNGLGNVNIEVTNPANMQKIANETVSIPPYRLSLVETVEEVEIYIVPSAESRVDGAGITYTIPVVRSVPGSVTIPDITLTNADTVPISVSLQEAMTVWVTGNGDNIYEESFEPGEHTIKIPLNGVNNDIIVYLVDANNNMQSTSFGIVKDIVAPTLSLDKTYHMMEVEGREVVISGYVKNATTLLINNIEIPFDETGRFEYNYPLNVGKNEISICAVDDAGNEAVSLADISMAEGRTNYGPLALVGLIVVVILVLFVLVVFKVMNMRRTPNTEPIEETPQKVKNKVVEHKEETISKVESSAKKSIKSNTTPISSTPEKPSSSKGKEDTVQVADKEGKKNTLSKRQRASFTTQQDAAIYARKLLRKHENKSFWKDLIVLFIVIVMFSFLCKACIDVTKVVSSSMEPRIMTGDFCIFNRLAYVRNDIERGDIISFDHQGSVFIKRVIGLPGDNISFKDGDLYINGCLVDESSYIAEDIETNSSKEFTVPPGCYFVMGDNRENSIDSRLFTYPYIERDAIRGKYLGHIPLSRK